MSYTEKLIESAKKAGNISCMGLEPEIETLPEHYKKYGINGFVHYFDEITDKMVEENISPAAFKPNFGFYLSENRPMAKNYIGSNALVDIIGIIRHKFPGIPIIADYRTGDREEASIKYSAAILNWDVDATIIHPYMGNNSVKPYFDMFEKNGRGIYVITKSSDSGSHKFQDVVDEKGPLYEKVASAIVRWSRHNKGIGSMFGTSEIFQLGDIAEKYKSKDIPLLIYYNGAEKLKYSSDKKLKQTNDEIVPIETQIVKIIESTKYNTPLARINSSDVLTHPWKLGPVPPNYSEIVVNNIKAFNEKTAYKRD